jgi:hypothetical protein
MGNVIDFTVRREAKNPPSPPQEPRVPWHIAEATWILQEIASLRDGFLTAWEIQFVISMATRRENVSPKQYAILENLGDKVETATTSPDAA